MPDSENRTTVKSIVRFAVVIVIGAWMLADAVPSVSRMWAPLGTFGYTAGCRRPSHERRRIIGCR